MPWSASVAQTMVSPFDFGPARRVEEPLGEVDGGAQRDEPELVLPAEAVGLELAEQVEHGEVVAELLAGRVARRSRRRRARPSGR